MSDRYRADSSVQDRAFHNVRSSIDSAASLPSHVFSGHWSCFLFFQSDALILPAFADVVRILMSKEGAVACCLLNFTASAELFAKVDTAATVVLTRETTGEDFTALMRGPDNNGWMFWMGRYGCASDRGSWCIYAERENEVGVIALKHENDRVRFTEALALLGAAPIEELIADPMAPLPYQELVEDWRRRLLENYV